MPASTIFFLKEAFFKTLKYITEGGDIFDL